MATKTCKGGDAYTAFFTANHSNKKGDYYAKAIFFRKRRTNSHE